MSAMLDTARKFFEACEIGKSIATDYVYAMQFKGEKIAHMTKIWNDSIALNQAGWI
jgi:hypothetical protein